MIEKLIKVQNELKAPKNQYNSFGKYKYRNQEDILEAVKPLLYKHGLMMTLTDKLLSVGDELFIEATVIITDGEKTHSVSAFAGLDINKKGMDKAQATGAAGSYARKYALNGCFLIDDSKDSDSTNTHGKTAPVGKPNLVDGSEAYLKAAQFVKGDGTVAQIKSKYNLTKEVEDKLNKL
jgi:hypothetical protein